MKTKPLLVKTKAGLMRVGEWWLEIDPTDTHHQLASCQIVPVGLFFLRYGLTADKPMVDVMPHNRHRLRFSGNSGITYAG